MILIGQNLIKQPLSKTLINADSFEYNYIIIPDNQAYTGVTQPVKYKKRGELS